jgi:hypothetical protein
MSGIGSRIFFLGVRAMSAVRHRTIGCSSTRSLSLSDGHSLARFAAHWFVEKHAPTLQPMVQERGFDRVLNHLAACAARGIGVNGSTREANAASPKRPQALSDPRCRVQAQHSDARRVRTRDAQAGRERQKALLFFAQSESTLAIAVISVITAKQQCSSSPSRSRWLDQKATSSPGC